MNRPVLLVECPEGCADERQYIVGEVFGTTLGLEVEVIPNPEITEWKIRVEGEQGELSVADVFLADAEGAWLDEASAPRLPLAIWTDPPAGDPLPVLFGREGQGWVRRSDDSVALGVDVFGSAFFMLSRYEEALPGVLDRHDRFPLERSVAFRAGVVERPLIDEYVDALWSLMGEIWPGLARKPHAFQITATHDVDLPFSFENPRTLLRFAKNLGVATLKLRSPKRLTGVLRGYFKHRADPTADDDFFNFPWIAEQCEKAGVPSAYYFIASDTGGPLEGGYSVTEPAISDLIKHLAERGHEIGLHGAYHSFDDAAQLRAQRERIESVSGGAVRGGRQHFLRWKTPASFAAWDAAGLEYDSTLTFAERPGFRCGTCRPFHTYDLATRRRLDLLERPLIAMEASVLDEKYLAAPVDEAAAHFAKVMDRCRAVGGDFVFLWHNNWLRSTPHRELFCSLLNG